MYIFICLTMITNTLKKWSVLIVPQLQLVAKKQTKQMYFVTRLVKVVIIQ